MKANDEIILKKNQNYQVSKVETSEDLLKYKENIKISLRKEKVDEYIMKKRMKNTDNSVLEIDEKSLVVKQEIRDTTLLNTPPVTNFNYDK